MRRASILNRVAFATPVRRARAASESPCDSRKRRTFADSALTSLSIGQRLRKLETAVYSERMCDSSHRGAEPESPPGVLPGRGRVRVAHDGAPAWGRLEDGTVELETGERLDASTASWLAPVTPSKIIAVHLTYRSRVDEYGAAVGEPSYFLKPPSALNGHLGEIARPAGTRFLNYEGELALVIGRRMKAVAEDEALDYVAGYAAANDVGLHDFRHADRGAMLRVKGQDGYLPLGPAVVSAEDFSPRRFELRTYLNGELVQEADQAT